jgi:hypothetical protein
MESEWVERELPTFARVSQNMAVMATLLVALPTPSIDEVDEVYQRLKRILSAAAAQQGECSMLHRVEASILPPSPGDRGPPREFPTRGLFLTSKIFGLRPLGLTECPVETSDPPAASPR